MQDIFELFSRGDVYLVGDLKGESIAIPMDMNNIRFTQEAGLSYIGRPELNITIQVSDERRVTVIDGEVPEEIRKTIRAYQRMANAGKNKAENRKTIKIEGHNGHRS